MQIRPFFTELLKASVDLLKACCCSAESGCPSCVQNFACHNELVHKVAAIKIIEVKTKLLVFGFFLTYDFTKFLFLYIERTDHMYSKWRF